MSPGGGGKAESNEMDPLVLLLASFAGAAILSAATTPVAAAVARRAGVVAPLRADRWGSRPTPLFGGVALVLSALLPAGILVVADRGTALVALGALAAMILGAVDDVHGLRPTSKIVGQTVIASGLALGGIGVEIIDVPVLSFALTLLWVVGMMNAVNLIDNMDGLAGGIAAIAAAVLLLMAPAEALEFRLTAAALTGACLGFLVHNVAPARVYLGDAGSQALGFVLAALALQLTNVAASNVALAVLGPLLVLGLPIFDTTLVAITRRLEGRPVSQGGRDHTSHRLAARGLDERTTVFVLWAIAGTLALSGLLSGALGLAFVPLAGLVVVGLVLFGVFLAEGPDAAGATHTPARRAVVGAGRRLIRFGSEIALDAALAGIALFSALLIRFESTPDVWTALFLQAAPILVPVQLGTFVLLNVYRILWSALAITDLVAVLRASFVGTLAAGVLILYAFNLTGQSRAVLLLDGILFALLVMSSRLFLVYLRHSFSRRPRKGDRRVLIIGASERGQLAHRLLSRSGRVPYQLAGYLDDDPGKLRRHIGGIPVLGRVSDLPQVAERQHADLVIVATDEHDPQSEAARQGCARLGIEIREFSPLLWH